MKSDRIRSSHPFTEIDLTSSKKRHPELSPEGTLAIDYINKIFTHINTGQ